MGMCRGTNQSGPVCSGLLEHIGLKLERPVQWSEVDSLEDAAQHCEQAGRTPGEQDHLKMNVAQIKQSFYV